MIQKSLLMGVAKALSPLVRVLIRYGVSHGDFSDALKRVFVDVARREFLLDGRKQTNARIAMLTGVQRKEVSRILSQPQTDSASLDLQYNRGVRVVGGWRRDHDFLDGDKPAALPLEGEGSFSELVRRYSGDLPARAVLDELLRVGCVARTEDAHVVLVGEGVHVPRGDREAQFNIMGNAARDLFSTIDHNLECAPHDDRLQLTVAYDNLTEKSVRRFQHISHEDSLALLRKFDSWLSERDRDTHPELENTEENAGIERYRAGIGIYYFEEEIDANT